MAKRTNSSTRSRQQGLTVPEQDSREEISDELRDTIQEDLGKIQAWVKTNSIDDLTKLCNSVAELVRNADPIGASKSSRILDRILPKGAGRLIQVLLTRPTGKLLDLVQELASRDLGLALRSIVLECAPVFVANASENSDVWDDLKALLGVNHDGDEELILTFTRKDRKAFTVRGDMDQAIGQVLPRIMRALAHSRNPGVDEDDLEKFRAAFRELDKALRRPQKKGKE